MRELYDHNLRGSATQLRLIHTTHEVVIYSTTQLGFPGDAAAFGGTGADKIALHVGQAAEQQEDYRRSVPLTTMSICRPPHREHTSRSSQSGAVVSAP
jgi:hypothetical protein